LKHVAAHFHLGWDLVKAIDKAFLRERLGPPDVAGVEVIAMDEFAIRRGHRYATVIADPYTRRVLWVGKDRTGAGLRPFFDLLGEEGRQRLKAVVMDMHGPWEQEIKQQCPQAEIVYDLFHVVAKYGREVVDRVRVDEANRLKSDPKQRKIVKGSRWLLLRNAENVTRPEDQVRLHELLDANAALATVYVLKDDLKRLWEFRSSKKAISFFKEWSMRAWDSGIEPLRKFTAALAARIHGVIAHCRWPLHTSFLEGINNKIKVLKRMAYGFRDHEYFFLKIRDAFHGNTG
jgi:transposase